MTLLPKTCFFTGHRFIRTDEAARVKSGLNEEILNAVNAGFTHFITGGAVGFDTLAAERIIAMREDYDQMRLILYLPCIDQHRSWRADDQECFERILGEADEIYYVTKEHYREGCMKKRNRAMVEASDMCIAYLKNMSSGTAQTVKMAKEKGIITVNIAEKVYID